MDETTVQIVSLVFMLVPLPLVVYGVVEGVAVLWWSGLVLVVVGGLIPPATRYVFGDEDEDEGESDDEGSSENEDGNGARSEEATET